MNDSCNCSIAENVAEAGAVEDFGEIAATCNFKDLCGPVWAGLQHFDLAGPAGSDGLEHGANLILHECLFCGALQCDLSIQPRAHHLIEEAGAVPASFLCMIQSCVGTLLQFFDVVCMARKHGSTDADLRPDLAMLVIDRMAERCRQLLQ